MSGWRLVKDDRWHWRYEQGFRVTRCFVSAEDDTLELGGRVAGALLRDNEGPDWMRSFVICARVAKGPGYYPASTPGWIGRPDHQMQ